MNLKNFRLGRPITSYTKVQEVVGEIARCNTLFFNENNIKDKVILNVGCGPYPINEFINLDYGWSPNIDICWDIVKKPYPLKSDTLEGIFTEHCLEHIPFESCLANLKEFHRMLKQDGTLRIIVPDGELYSDLYQERKLNPNVKLPYGDSEETGMISINRIFRSHGHLFIYDFETFKMLLKKAGFSKIEKRSFRQGSDPRLLIDRPERAVESLYVEAVK